MLQSISNKCTNILLKNGIIQTDKKAILIYGFELFWSLILCIISILSICLIFNCMELAITFLLSFIPIRVVSGGYHAKSYVSCFVLTNFIAVICIFASKSLWKWRVPWLDGTLWLIMLVVYLYIWRNSPVVSAKYPLKPEKITKHRVYVRYVLMMELGILLLVNIWSYNYIIYTSIITSCVVAIMIIVVKKGEK